MDEYCKTSCELNVLDALFYSYSRYHLHFAGKEMYPGHTVLVCVARIETHNHR